MRTRGNAAAEIVTPWVSLGSLLAGLLAYANASAWRYASRQKNGFENPSHGLERVNRGHLAMLGACLAWAAAERIGLSDLGMGRNAGPSLRWGLTIGTLGSAVAAGFLAMPVVRSRFTPPPEWNGMRKRTLLRLFLGPYLLGSALFEEVAFRGLLHAKLRRRFGPSATLFAGGAVFAAWHVIITWFNLSRCGLRRAVMFPLYGASLLVLFAVGTALGWLRQATGHIAGGVVAHWLLLVGTALALMRRRAAVDLSASSRSL
ncbi:MAG: CPBP family intramembrane metalloprotease [Chloroflexi bacterium]|nr:CPBP family intramembrane metalloprotease [Chloroflexota bacterium]